MAMKGVNLRVGATNHTQGTLSGVTKGLKNVRNAQNSVQKSNRGFVKGMNANRRIIQQVGFQLSDVSVQIAGGQSAILALTQNVPQVVQMFGALGGILAALITIIGTLTLVMVRSGKGFSDLAGFAGVTHDELAKIGNIAGKVKEAMIDFTNVVINNLDVLLISATLFASYMGGKFVANLIAANGAVGLLTKGLVALRKALVLTGIGALIVGLAFLIERLITLNRATGDWGKTIMLIGELAKQVFDNIGLVLNIVALRVDRNAARMKASWSKALAEMLSGMPDWVNKVIGFFVGLGKAIVEIFKQAFANVRLVMDLALQRIENNFNGLIARLNKLPGVEFEFIEPDIERLTRIAKQQSATMGNTVGKAFTDALEGTYVGAGGSLTQNFIEEAEMWSKSVSVIEAELGKLEAQAGAAIPAWQEIKSLLGSVTENQFDIRSLFGGKDKGDDKDTKALIKRFKTAQEAARQSIGAFRGLLDDSSIDKSIARYKQRIMSINDLPAFKQTQILASVDELNMKIKSMAPAIQSELDKLNKLNQSGLKAINADEYFRQSEEIVTRIQQMSGPIAAEIDYISNLHPELSEIGDIDFLKSLVDANRDTRGKMDALRGIVGEHFKLAPIDLPEINISGFTKNISKAQEFLRDLTGEINTEIKGSFKDLIKGTSSLSDALSNVLDKIADKILDFALDSLFTNLGGALGGGGGGFGGLIAQGLGSILSFNGGGFTGSGSRSGGVDGKGGFPAILHPNETVIDHTKITDNKDMGKQYSPANDSMGSVTMVSNNYFNGVTREEVMADVKQSQNDMEQRLNAELPGKLNRQRFDRGRGIAVR